MSEQSPQTSPRPPFEDERNHPVYKAGRAVAAFMAVVWAGVVILVLYLVFRFWLG